MFDDPNNAPPPGLVDPWAPAEWLPPGVVGAPMPAMPMVAEGPPPMPQPFAPPEWEPGGGLVDPFAASQELPRPAPEPMAAPPPQAPPGDFETDMGAPPPVPPPMSAEDEAAAMVEKGPQFVAREGIRREAEAADEFNEDNARVEMNDERLRERAINDHAKARAALLDQTAKLEAESAAWAKKDVNEEGWWDSRSTGQKIALYLSAFIKGWQGKGADEMVSMVQGAIRDDIGRQQAKLNREGAVIDKKQGALSSLMAQNDDDLRSSLAIQQGALEASRRQLAAERAKYDPRGTLAQKYAEADMAFAAAQAKAKADGEAALLEREYKVQQIASSRANVAQGWSADKRARIGQKVENESKGFDAKGNPIPGWKPPEEPLKPSDVRAENELVVMDAITQKPLGKATSKELAGKANEAQQAAIKVARLNRELSQLREEIGTTTDLPVKGSWLRGSDNDARVASYKSKSIELANAIAKAEDPTSAIRDAERDQIIKDRIPQFNTPLGEGPEAAAAKQAAIKDSVKASVAGHMGAAGIKYDIGHYFDDEDAPNDTPTSKAARAADSYRQVERPLGKPDPESINFTEKERQLKNPIGRTDKVTEGINALTVEARKGDAEALRHLQVIANNPKHSAQGEAELALAELLGPPRANPRAE